jgi:hypothetical protein
VPHNVFYWLQSSVTGGGQYNQGPFNPGTVNRLLKVESRGMQNYEAAAVATNGVLANLALWGIQWVAHGASPLDILISLDSDQWLIREQETGEDYQSVWAPQTTIPGVFSGYGLNRTWRGQYQIAADIDFYVSWALPFGGSWPNWNSFGNLRAWWS